MNCRNCDKLLKTSLNYCIYCYEPKATPTGFIYYLNKFKKYIRRLNNAYKTYRNKHNFTPTFDNAITLKKIKFYSDYFLYKDIQIDYNQIYGITYKFSKKYLNGIRTVNDISFYFYFNSKFFGSKPIQVNLSVVDEIFVWRKRETTTILLNWLLAKTRQNRLSNYLLQIRELGYFSYDNIKIYNNGNLIFNNQGPINLKKEFENGNVWYGVAFNSIFGQKLGQDPYFFRIKNGVQKPRLFGKRNIDINIEYNKDIFDLFIERILKNGCIIEGEYIK